MKQKLKFIGNILVLLSLVFIILKIYNMHINFLQYFSGSNILKFIVLLLFFVALIFIQFIPWKLFLQNLTSTKFPNKIINYIFLKSSLMKYIPGNIFQYIGRESIASYYQSLNVINVTTSIIFESVSAIISALLIGIIASHEYTLHFFAKHQYFLFSLCLFLLFLCILLFLMRKKISLFLYKKNIHITIQLIWTFFVSIVFFCISLLIQGLILTFILCIVGNQNFLPLFFSISGAFSISWVAGYITPGASGGIGVREVIICLILGNSIGEDSILAAILLFRFLNILADIFSYLLVLILNKIDYSIYKNGK